MYKALFPIVKFTVIGTLFFFLFTSFVGFYLVVRPPKLVSDTTPADFGVGYEEVAFHTEDNILLRGWLVPHERGSETGTIILLHGYPADKGNVFPVTRFLAEEYNLLYFDFRHLGESEGRYSTAGAKEVKDFAAAIEFLHSRGLEEFGIWGFSAGGAVALQGARGEHGVKAIISDSSYARMDLLAEELFRIPVLDKPLGLLSQLWGRLFIGINPAEVSPMEDAALLDIPVFIIHSRADDVIPFSHALLLQDALQDNPRAEFWFREDALHGQIGSEYRSRVQDFFARHLR